MSKPLIQVENLSKAYRIGLKEEIPDSLVGAVTGWMKAPLRNWKRLRSLNTFQQGPQSNGEDSGTSTESNPQTDDIVWALNDVSFDVHEGDVVGIIGRNGAGKSTLLKILSRITEPTAGRAVIRGRVSSLLEVGTGFHPELTGRENIYMNGTILGMTKQEIDRKFDEIVDFSGVDRFLDTPIKRYSSGMKVRLAFAVAAHLDPEILIIDEVLAVGDAEFQKKCLGKMQNVAASGRTVLFVSHNMASVQSLCSRGILIAGGTTRLQSTIDSVIAHYRQLATQTIPSNLAQRTDRSGLGEVRLTGISLLSADTTHNDHCSVTTGRTTRFVFDVSKPIAGLQAFARVFDSMDNLIAVLDSRASFSDTTNSRPASRITCEFDHFLLLPGQYRLDVWILVKGATQDAVDTAVTFNVAAGDIDGHAPREYRLHPCVHLPHTWSLQHCDH